jgi:2-C-methyl-D-erythritol 2,4-cyclodiphosphate synthase
MIRIGHGYDVHRLAPDRKLILGGVAVPFDLGLLGHSDADVLCHAICDALLGAAALGDIGKHFPDTDEKYKNISSILLLRNVVDLLREKEFSICNVDSTLILQTPKVSPYIREMRDNIAWAMNIGIEHISVKATTTEGLGFTGRGEGVAAHAVVLIETNGA